jgi:hypothetical protein
VRSGARAALFLGLCLASACERSPAPGPSAARDAAAPQPLAGAQDAVLWVDDVPITRAELQPLADSIGLLYPQYVERQRLRLALTNVALPRAAARARWPAEREAARAAAADCARDLSRGAPPGTPSEIEVGHWKSLGLEAWARLREAEPGVWSEPFEDVGRFQLVRLVSVEKAGERPGQETYTVEIQRFAYLPAEEPTRALEAAIDAARLRVEDAAIGELVPETWKERMRGPRE